MTSSRTAWHVVEAPNAASLDDAEAWAYHGIAAVSEACQQDLFGHADLAQNARGVLVGMDNQQYTTKHRFVAVRDPASGDGVHPGASDVVGHAFIAMPEASNRHLAEIHVAVDPAHRGQGIGSALLASAEEVVAAAGRTQVIGEPMFAAEAPEGMDALTPSNGSGRVPADLPTTRFATRHGFALAQVSRKSVLDLPVDAARLARFEDESRAAAGPDFRLHTWQDEIPEEWLDGLAVLETRMTTDAPHGDLDVDEDVWDADRVRTFSEMQKRNRNGYLITAVEHVPSGALAGHSMLLYPLEDGPFAFQEDTIVLREHRGHRLGMLLKAVNLAELARVRPSTERIHTFNAEENQHMLAINVALGFRPAGGAAAYQRSLA
ncbi:GNAT family N-acetyltransferase [Antribacter sp. KLBMP9083]|uniref:GNAT family N-acetyltransferase n=1 Tax=Antribacter soli TaxID=2910976 RepID=A0AA41QHK8_9MICO|nr:GNAT family N-acetyltransferase [Antribacter soli]MCF4123633.1 GNAT family N-acetyltransferase [Antribacter soli]